jgi:branched-chain amino acid transport system substrate-binding protein
MKSIATAIQKAGGSDPERLILAFNGLELATPLGPIAYRGIDHQATLGTYIGLTSLREERGIVKDFAYVDGRFVMPSDAEVTRLRPRE